MGGREERKREVCGGGFVSKGGEKGKRTCDRGVGRSSEAGGSGVRSEDFVRDRVVHAVVYRDVTVSFPFPKAHERERENAQRSLMFW